MLTFFFFLFLYILITFIVPNLSIVSILIILLFFFKVSLIMLIHNSFDDFYYYRKEIPFIFYDSYYTVYVEYLEYCTIYVIFYHIGIRLYFCLYSFFFYMSAFLWVNLFFGIYLIYKALKPFLWRYLLFRLFFYIFLFTIIVCFLRYSIFFFMIINYPIHTFWWISYMFTGYFYFIDTIYINMIERIRSSIDTLFVIYMVIVGTGLHMVPPI